MATPENESETGKPQVVSPTAACNSNPPKSQNQQLPLPEPSGTLRNLQLLPLKRHLHVQKRSRETCPNLLHVLRSSLPLPGPCYTKTCAETFWGSFWLQTSLVSMCHMHSHAACLALMSSCHFKEHRDQVHYTNRVPTVRLGLPDAHLVSTHMELHYFTGNFPTILPVHYAQELLPNSP